MSHEFRAKIQVKFHWTMIVKKKPILRQTSLESDRFCADFTNIFNKTRRQFAQFWGGGKWWALACAITTTTETLTTYKKFNVTLLKVVILSSKPPFALRCHLDLVFSCTGFFYQRSSFALWATKLFISCTGQCPVFRNNNLKTPGSFGTFSRCGDEVSK